MDRIIRWRRMKYGTGERDPERDLGVLLFCVRTSEKTERCMT